MLFLMGIDDTAARVRATFQKNRSPAYGRKKISEDGSIGHAIVLRQIAWPAIIRRVISLAGLYTSESREHMARCLWLSVMPSWADEASAPSARYQFLSIAAPRELELSHALPAPATPELELDFIFAIFSLSSAKCLTPPPRVAHKQKNSDSAASSGSCQKYRASIRPCGARASRIAPR